MPGPRSQERRDAVPVNDEGGDNGIARNCKDLDVVVYLYKSHKVQRRL